MKSDIYRFASEMPTTEFAVVPNTIGVVFDSVKRFPTLDERRVLHDYATYKHVPHDRSVEILKTLTGLDYDWVLKGYAELVGIEVAGVGLRRTDEQASEVARANQSGDVSGGMVREFFHRTNLNPITKPAHLSRSINHAGRLGAYFSSEGQNISLGSDVNIRELCHELTHAANARMAVSVLRKTIIDPDTGSYGVAKPIKISSGLSYYGVNDYLYGQAVDEANAEFHGAHVARALGARSATFETGHELVDPYINGISVASSAANAIAMTMIAEVAGISEEEFFKRLSEYARSGIENVEARKEIAGIVEKGTRGILTLADIELLPYPAGAGSSLVLLGAVEDILSVQRGQRPSKALHEFYAKKGDTSSHYLR